MMTNTDKQRSGGLLPGMLAGLGKWAGQLDAGLQNLRGHPPILPADVGKRLQEAMLAQENLLEDARYFKIAPNDYLVELNEANYNQHYKPVEKLVCEQWREKLLKLLNTTNSRQGRRVYRFGGNVRIRIRPVAELGEDEVRIHCQVNAEVGAVAVEAVLPCLELLAEGRQWPLGEEITVIGRDDGCDVFLDEPLVQLTRLISRRHAYIRREDDHFVLYDGSPEGKASLNGTFVNGQPVLAGGHILQDDDLIILAALEPGHPCLDTPGVAAFRFQTSAHVISRPTVGAKSRSEHP